ncbi:MAG TPA: type II toxin-antitoxin system YoeB family toxin [bacterium]|nr:type II toxin-antitoxin system YoeB family toxin [bacterium]
MKQGYPTARRLSEILTKNSCQSPPPYERLLGDLERALSRRINIQHRLVYQAIDETKTVKVIRMWTRYD